MKNLYKIMFFNLMIISTLISISSTSWFISWIGLEMNLMSFIPLMTNKKNKYSIEAMIKYFIVQSMASSMLLFSIIIFMNLAISKTTLLFYSSMITNTALLMKMGAAPFHFWLPEVSSALNWKMNFFLLTWQKITPMMLLSYNMYMPTFFFLTIIFSSLVGSLQGLNQICLRKIMAYSSITHLGWMIAAMMNSLTIWFYYFIIYTIINFNIMAIFNKFKIFYMKQLNKMFWWNSPLKFLFMLNFLSLSGMPPFLGFFPKWITINFLINYNFYSISLLLIITTMASIYIYMRITFSSLTMNSKKTMIMIFSKMNNLYLSINFLSLSSLLFCATLMNMF